MGLVLTACSSAYRGGAYRPFQSWRTSVVSGGRGQDSRYRSTRSNSAFRRDAILVEPKAPNTGDNIEFTRDLLNQQGRKGISSVMLISRPYQQRRSYAICRK
ncbi:YdcF family protein [Nocardia sp. NBC_01009]|uniref:YdcF family protein n=1 Tax=Nocardia sp. NBC_01009 TaxID=2975996 RepID=UPI00386CDB69